MDRDGLLIPLLILPDGGAGEFARRIFADVFAGVFDRVFADDFFVRDRVLVVFSADARARLDRFLDLLATLPLICTY